MRASRLLVPSGCTLPVISEVLVANDGKSSAQRQYTIGRFIHWKMLNAFGRTTKFRVYQEAESHTEEKIAHINCVKHTLTPFKAHTYCSLSIILLTYQLIYSYINEE